MVVGRRRSLACRVCVFRKIEASNTLLSGCWLRLFVHYALLVHQNVLNMGWRGFHWQALFLVASLGTDIRDMWSMAGFRQVASPNASEASREQEEAKDGAWDNEDRGPEPSRRACCMTLLVCQSCVGCRLEKLRGREIIIRHLSTEDGARSKSTWCSRIDDRGLQPPLIEGNTRLQWAQTPRERFHSLSPGQEMLASTALGASELQLLTRNPARRECAVRLTCCPSGQG